MMRGTSGQFVGIVALVVGLFIGLSSELSFNAWLIERDQYDRCSSMDAPAGAVRSPEEMVFDAHFTKLPLGLTCSWKLENGEVISQAFPLWAWTTYEFAGWLLAAGGVFVLIRRHHLRDRPASPIPAVPSPSS